MGCRVRRRDPRRLTIDRHDRQAVDFDQPILTGQRERSTVALLLREPADLMIQRIVDRDLTTDFNRQAPGLGEVGVTHAVL